MKNVQIIDDADNATFSIFQATEAEFDAIFPEGRDIEFADDLFSRLGEERAREIVEPMWERPILKSHALGVHGTLYYGWSNRRRHLPQSKREVDIDSSSLNPAQCRLFGSVRNGR